jgi:hypothetical protein
MPADEPVQTRESQAQPQEQQVQEVEAQAQETYDRIERTWRLQSTPDKIAMVKDLKAYPSTSLAGLVAKLIDEIETEVRLEEIEDSQ